MITKDKFIDLTLMIAMEKKISSLEEANKILQEKADKYDYAEYWSTGGRAGHGAG